MRCLFFLLLIILTHTVYGQIGFKQSYHFGDSTTTTGLTNIVILEDTLHLFGLKRKSLPPFQTGFLYARADTSGQIIDHHLYFDSDSTEFSLSQDLPWGVVLTQDSSAFLVLGYSVGRGKNIIHRINKQGELLSTTAYEDSTAIWEFYEQIIPSSGGHIVMGSKRISSSIRGTSIFKIDHAGNKVWEKFYIRPYNITTAFKENENSFLAGGLQEAPNWSPEAPEYILTIFAIDSLGQQLWEWDSPLITDEVTITGLQKNSLGHWVYVTFQRLYANNGPFIHDRLPKFISRDHDFNLVNSVELDTPETQEDYFRNLIPINAGGFLGTGINVEFFDVPDSNNIVGHGYAWLVRFSDTGEVLWERKDLILPDTTSFFTKQEIITAVELSSGSIIAAGTLTSQSLAAPRAFLIKVDKHGCLDTLSCDLMVDITEAGVAPPEVKVFPNPTGNQITFALPHHQTHPPLHWRVFNSTGLLVGAGDWPDTSSEVHWNTSHLVPGLYHYHIITSNGSRGQAGTFFKK